MDKKQSIEYIIKLSKSAQELENFTKIYKDHGKEVEEVAKKIEAMEEAERERAEALEVSVKNLRKASKATEEYYNAEEKAASHALKLRKEIFADYEKMLRSHNIKVAKEQKTAEEKLEAQRLKQAQETNASLTKEFQEERNETSRHIKQKYELIAKGEEALRQQIERTAKRAQADDDWKKKRYADDQKAYEENVKKKQELHEKEFDALRQQIERTAKREQADADWKKKRYEDDQKALEKQTKDNEKELNKQQSDRDKANNRHRKRVQEREDFKQKEADRVIGMVQKTNAAVERETDKHLTAQQRATKKQINLHKDLTSSQKAINEAVFQGHISSKKGAELMKSVNASFADLAKNGGKASNHMQKIFLGIPAQIKLLKVQLFHTLIGRITMKFAEAFDEARKLAKAVAEIQTIQGKANITTLGWTKSLTNLSSAMGIDVLDLAESAYQALSNQVVKAGDSYLFMTEAANFAKVTNSSMADSVNLLSSVMNSYDLSVVAAERVSAILFKTIELGRIRASEFANTIGNLSVLAKQAGMSIEEWNTSLQVLTVNGVKSNTAITLMTNVLQKMIRPTEAGKELFKEWGVESGIAAIETFGFMGVLERLSVVAEDKGIPALGEVAGRVRALRGILGQASDEGLDKFSENFEEMTKTLEDSSKPLADYRKALEGLKDSLSFKAEQDITELKNVLTVGFSTELLKQFKEFSAMTGGNLSTSLKALTDSMLGVVETFKPLVWLLNVGVEGINSLNLSTKVITRTVLTFYLTTKAWNLVLAKTNMRLSTSQAMIAGMSTSTKAASFNIKSMTTSLNLSSFALNKVSLAATTLGASLKAMFLSNPIGILLTVATAAYSAFAAASDKIESIRSDTLARFEQQDAEYFKTVAEVTDKAITTIADGMEKSTKGFRRYLAAVNADLNSLKVDPKKFKEMNEQLERTSDLVEDIKEKQLIDSIVPKGNELNSFQTVINDLHNLSRTVTNRNTFKFFDRKDLDNTRDFQKTVLKIYSQSETKTLKLLTDLQKAEEKAKGVMRTLLSNRDEELFERSITGVSDEEVQRLTIQRIQTLRIRANQNANTQIEKDSLASARSLMNSLVIQMKSEEGVISQAMSRLDQDLFAQESGVAGRDAAVAAQKVQTAEALKNRITTERQNLLQGVNNWETQNLSLLEQQISFQERLNRGTEENERILKRINTIRKDTTKMNQMLLEQQQQADEAVILNANNLGATASEMDAQLVTESVMPYAGDMKGKLAEEIEKFRKIYKDPGSTNEEIQTSLEAVRALLRKYQDLPMIGEMMVELRRKKDDPQKLSVKAMKEKFGEKLSNHTMLSPDAYFKELERIRNMQDNFTELEKNLAKVNQNKTIIAEAEIKTAKIMNGLKREEEKIQKRVKKNLDGMLPQLDAFATEVTNLKRATMGNAQRASQLTGKPTRSFNTGGLITGPPGIDNQLIWAHAGEVVVNSDASRQFYSELVAMNHGYRPNNFENGGPVTQMGDINISVQTTGEASTGTAVRDIGDSLRREFRRGNLGRR